MTCCEQTSSNLGVGKVSTNLQGSSPDNPEAIDATNAELLTQITELEKQLSFADETIRRLRRILDGFEDEHLKILTVQDYAIGVEQELGKAKSDLEKRNAIDHELRTEIIETHERLARAIEHVQQARNTPYQKVRQTIGAGLRKVGLR